MKKLIYTAIALAAVVVGCTKSNIVDVPEDQKTPIAFDTYNGRIPVTRASEITKDNISSIQVTGFHVPTGGSADYTKTYMNPTVKREKSGETWGSWGYSPLSYWPASGTLEFVAYGSNTPRTTTSEAGKLVAVEDSYANFTYTVPEVVASQQDLIASNKATYSESAGTVTFTMNHLLSRIGFTLKTIGTGATVKISAVELHGNFINTGSVNLVATQESTDENGSTVTSTVAPSINTTDYSGEDYITPSYSLFAEGEYFETTSDDNATEGVHIYARSNSNLDASNRYMMLIPGTISSAIDDDDTNGDDNTTDSVAPYIKVVYELSGASEQTAIIPFTRQTSNTSTEYWTLEAGKAYEFIFTVSVDQIEFTGSVEPWDETTADQPIYPDYN